MHAPTLALPILLILSIGAAAPRAHAEESTPTIDFPMLDQVKPRDLIEGELAFPEALRNLEGQRVSLVGFMAPFDNLRDMRRCMIVPSYVGCRFCSPPSLDQVVYVTQETENTSQWFFPFIEAPSLVTGILRLSQAGAEHEGKRQGFVYSLENAVIREHGGDLPARAPGHSLLPHQLRTEPILPIASSALVQRVAEIVNLEQRDPITIEEVSLDEFSSIIRIDLESTYSVSSGPARTAAFRLMGLLPAKVDWIDTLLEFELGQSVAVTSESGDQVFLLEGLSLEHPFVRLDLVGEIAEALTLQRYPELSHGAESVDRVRQQKNNDDHRRAIEALRLGFRTMAVSRYAREAGIPPGSRPPADFVQQSLTRWENKSETKLAFDSVEFGLWLTMPQLIGSFFVDSLVGDTAPLSGVHEALRRPPSTSMEFFRPQWYEDASLWRPNPVLEDFADASMNSPPILTDVLGIGGLVPLLSQWYSVDAAKSLAGMCTGDRWALWQHPDGAWALMLETRWKDEEAAIRFRDAIPQIPHWRLKTHNDGSVHVQLMRYEARNERLPASAPLDAP